MDGIAVEGPERLDRDRSTDHGTPSDACVVGISRSRIVDQILHVSVGASDGACLAGLFWPQKFWRTLPFQYKCSDCRRNTPGPAQGETIYTVPFLRGGQISLALIETH
jgi:hypothetical protein